jgi:hypothetical protein
MLMSSDAKSDVWPPAPIVAASMTEEKMRHIESALHLTLPVFYRDTMLNLPSPLPDVYPLCDDADFLIRDNLLLRECVFSGLPWPDHYFAIGGDGAGNAFYLDLSHDSHVVYRADHEAGDLAPIEPDFVTWARDVVEGWAVYEAEQAVEEKRQEEHLKNRKWWQVRL